MNEDAETVEYLKMVIKAGVGELGALRWQGRADTGSG